MYHRGEVSPRREAEVRKHKGLVMLGGGRAGTVNSGDGKDWSSVCGSKAVKGNALEYKDICI